jgi:hypothetical protein
MSLGIEAVKPAIKVAADLRNITADALADGKFTPMEIFAFVPALLQVQGIIESGPQILAQLKEADHNDRAALEAYAKEELKIADQEVEQFIGDALDWAIATLQLFISGKQSLRSVVS